MVDFLGDRRDFILVAAFFWVGVWMVYGLWRRSRRGPHFPRLSKVMVVFREDFVSGRSYKLSGETLGRALSSLIVIVTRDELWVTTCFPFTAFTAFYDLEYRIPLSSVSQVKRTGKWFDLDFSLADGSLRHITLRIRRTQEFLAAIDQNDPGL